MSRTRTAAVLGAIVLSTALAAPAPSAAAPDDAAPANVSASDDPRWRAVASSPRGDIVASRPEHVPISDAPITVRDADGASFPARVTPTGGLLATVPAGQDPSELTTWVGGTPLSERAAPTPAAADPAPVATASAGYRVVTSSYTAGSIRLPRLGEPVDAAVRGHVVGPVGAPGQRPVVLFLHGRHDYCTDAKGNGLSMEWPCAQGMRPIDSYLGYDYAQRELASRGYVTVSIDANAVNANDDTAIDGGAAARSALVRANLRALAAWSGAVDAPWASSDMSAFRLDRTVLVGHSRGGDGVNQAATDSRPGDPWRIAGLVHVAPTNFWHQSLPTLPAITLLPTCDGDVTDLQGQQYTDAASSYGPGAAFHASVRVPGANHNFFNTEWTPGTAHAPAVDDAGADCRGGRISAGAQRSVLGAYVVAAARAFADGSAAALRSLDGSIVHPSGTSVTGLRSVPVGGQRRVLWSGLRWSPGRPIGAARTGSATWCSSSTCIPRRQQQQAPHWLAGDDRDGRALRLRLGGAGAVGGLEFPRPVDLSDGSRLEARVIVRGTTARVQGRLTDAAGRSLSLTPDRGAALAPLAGRSEAARPRYLAQLWRAPLPTAGIDLHRIRRVEWVSASGQADLTVLDTSIDAPRARVDTDAPRLSLPWRVVTVMEGSAPHTATVPVTFDRPLPRPVRIAPVVEPWDVLDPGRIRPVWVAVPAGARSASVPVRVDGDRVDDMPVRPSGIRIEVRGPAAVQRATGMFAVEDDDPDPTLVAVSPRWARTSAGGTLQWKVTTDIRTDRTLGFTVLARRPGTAPELRKRDLTAASALDWNLYAAGRSSTLSAAGAKTWGTIDPQHRVATIRLPVAWSISPLPRRTMLVVQPDGSQRLRSIVLQGTVR